MTSRTRRILLSAIAIVTLQGALWLGYRAVTRARRAPADMGSEVVVGRRTPPDATVLLRNGTTTTLAERTGNGPVLLHFWATWCVPCQKELPALLELARSPDRPSSLGFVLVSLDQDWRPVEAFFDGAIPEAVVRDGGGLASALEVSTLPDTYLLGPDRTPLARFHGARDWGSPELGRELRRLLASGR